MKEISVGKSTYYVIKDLQRTYPKLFDFTKGTFGNLNDDIYNWGGVNHIKLLYYPILDELYFIQKKNV